MECLLIMCLTFQDYKNFTLVGIGSSKASSIGILIDIYMECIELKETQASQQTSTVLMLWLWWVTRSLSSTFLLSIETCKEIIVMSL
jgi:hypothetical protein